MALTHDKQVQILILLTWIIECLEMFQITEQIVNFITRAMENWKAELTVGRQTQADAQLE